MLGEPQRHGQQDDDGVAKTHPGTSTGKGDDGDLESGEVTILGFPKSLNDFYKGRWYPSLVHAYVANCPHHPHDTCCGFV